MPSQIVVIMLSRRSQRHTFGSRHEWYRYGWMAGCNLESVVIHISLRLSCVVAAVVVVAVTIVAFFWKFKLNLFFFLLIFMIMLFLFTVSFVRSFVCYLFVFVIRNRFGWCRIGSILCRILSLLSVYSRSKYSVKHLVRYWLQVHSRIIKGLPLPCPALPCLTPTTIDDSRPCLSR